MRLAVALAGLHHRLLHVGVEGLAVGLDPLQALGPKGLGELVVHELDALVERLEVRLALGGDQREVELVQDLEQSLHEALQLGVDQPLLRPRHALAVVLELGLQPLQVVAVLGRLRPGPGELVLGRRLIGRGRAGLNRRVLALAVAALVDDADLRPLLVVLPLVVVAHWAFPSSTISPSTTSSSLSAPGVAAASPGGSPPPALDAAVCWPSGVCWYIAWPTAWN